MSEMVSSQTHELLTQVSKQLIEEKWTRTTIENYSKRNFLLLDELIEKAKKENLCTELKELCVDYLNNQSSNSISALYIAGILIYEQEIIDDSYIFQIINLFKENKKWLIVEFLAKKILFYGENNFSLNMLEEVYIQTKNKENILLIWERLSKVNYENGEYPKKLAQHYEKNDQFDECIYYYKMALKRFVKSHHGIKIIEDIWLKLVEYVPEEIDFFYSLYDELLKTNVEKAAYLLSLLLPYYHEKKKDYKEVIILLKKILKINLKDKILREKLVESVQNCYKDHSQLESYIKKSGLDQSNVNVLEAIENFEKYIVFDKDSFVFHRSWGIGKIVNCEKDSFIIDFEMKRKHLMSFKIALTSLKVLSEDHIWIQKRRNIEGLKNKNDANEIENILVIIFKSYGNQATMKEIRKEMTDIIPSGTWIKWWNKAKQVMKTSSIFGNSLTKRDLYFLRNKPLSFKEKSFSSFNASPSFDKKLSILADYLKHSDDIDDEGFQQMLNFFVEIINNKNNIDEKTIKSFLILRKIKRDKPNTSFEFKLNAFELLSAKEDLINTYNSLQDSEYKKNILDIIKKNDSDWVETFLRLLKESRAGKTHSIIVNELLEYDDKILKEGLDYIIDHYRNNHENYFWVLKLLLADEELFLSFNYNKNRLIFNLFHCLDMMNKELTTKKGSQRKISRKLFPQIIDFLLKDNFFDNYIKNINKIDVRKVLALINALNLINEKTKSTFLSKIFNQFGNIIKEKEEESSTLHKFLVTKSSYERKQRELQHIVNVEIPDNSKAIGIAKELGDLRENADYIAALEHQKQLQQLASSLTDELNRVKILNLDEISENIVNPGTQIKLKNMNNQEIEQYIILGEWESNMEKKIISYKSPFGQSLLGARVNDFVTFNHEKIQKKYQITEIKKLTVLL